MLRSKDAACAVEASKQKQSVNTESTSEPSKVSYKFSHVGIVFVKLEIIFRTRESQPSDSGSSTLDVIVQEIVVDL